MAIWTYVRNADPKNKITGIELEGGLTLYLGTYANLSNNQLQEIYSSGIGAILEEGIVPPATPAGGGGEKSNATVVAIWAPFTRYVENQLIMHEGELLRALRNFETGATYEF